MTGPKAYSVSSIKIVISGLLPAGFLDVGALKRKIARGTWKSLRFGTGTGIIIIRKLNERQNLEAVRLFGHVW